MMDGTLTTVLARVLPPLAGVGDGVMAVLDGLSVLAPVPIRDRTSAWICRAWLPSVSGLFRRRHISLHLSAVP